MIKIRCPIWKTRSVGLAEHKLSKGINKVKILYKTKSGEELYPNTFYMDYKEIIEYPVQLIKNVKLRIIPISNFKTEQEIKKLKLLF